MRAPLLLLALISLPCWARPLPPLTVHDVGEYGAIPWEDAQPPIVPGSRGDRVRDLNLGVSSININQAGDIPQANLDRWAKAAKLGAQRGCKFLPRVYFWDGADRYEGPMRDIEVYWKRLDQFLGAMDLNDFYGIVLAEENVSYAGRPEVLAELYRRIKAKYDVAVWQWWSPMTSVPADGGWIPADGWVIDPYFLPTEQFRRYLCKYLITGKPIVLMPAASTEFEMTPERWKLNWDQLQIAVEYNLPVAFYWVKGNTCYFPGDRNATTEPIDQINQWVWRYIERVKGIARDYTGASSADRAEGQVREIGPIEGDQFVYADDFSTERVVDDATMEGFRDLVMDGQTLSARGFGGRKTNVTLDYEFRGDVAVRYPEVRLDVQIDPARHGRVQVTLPQFVKAGPSPVMALTHSGKIALSSAGVPAFAETRQFRVSIKMTGDAGDAQHPPCRLDNLRVSGVVVRPETPVARLRGFGGQPTACDYQDTFATRKYLYTTTRTGDDKLEWSEGRIAVRLQPGGAAPELVWKVVSERPVEAIEVQVDGRANRGSLGTNHYLDVSLDGKTWTDTVDTSAMKMDVNGWTSDPLVVDLAGRPQYTKVREFYVRLRMVAEGYKERHPVQSGVVTGLRIDARISR